MTIAIVTGASSGMGREMVIQLADQFGSLDQIWAVARRGERLVQLENQVPVPLRIFPLDLCEENALAALGTALQKERPKVRFLVNAAGFGKIGRAEEIPLADTQNMVRLNCEALCAVTQLVLPYMPDNSRIIQFASAAAFLPQPGFSVYAATKAFVLSYSLALGAELKDRGIGVTAVCPGPVKTEFFKIAETTGKIALYKRLAMADCRRVVKLALKDSILKKRMSVYGLLMKAFRLLCKVLPQGLLLDFMRKLK